ncbi:hypothetical protein EUGRSUZ_K03493 [Eucalyptus grandis]|uniref:Uncharacterized protein n=2 Tax=Eucalyptus grandis TaxID=71139 RepID=A0A059A7I6_EUCGR|nr:hypothetical protein EUGRSUZ_K03493 [Eucalyptus grandis]
MLSHTTVTFTLTPFSLLSLSLSITPSMLCSYLSWYEFSSVKLHVPFMLAVNSPVASSSSCPVMPFGRRPTGNPYDWSTW